MLGPCDSVTEAWHLCPIKLARTHHYSSHHYSSNLPTTCGESKQPHLWLLSMAPSSGNLATNQLKDTLGTEEVPGPSWDILLFLASLLAKRSRKAQPNTSSLQWALQTTNQEVGRRGQALHNPTLRPEHLENRMLATTPILAWGRSQAAHQTGGACHPPKGGD